MIILGDSGSLATALCAAPERVVAIDGWTLAGKSTLGLSVASLTGRTLIDLDDLLHKDRGSFAAHIDYQSLRASLDTGEQLVLAGVCMRSVLERAGIKRAVHVYVKRMHLGYWTDEDEATLGESAFDRHIAPTELRLEMRRYHAEYFPHLRSDYVLERTATD